MKKNEKIADFVRFCEERGCFPTDRALCLYLKCSACQLRELQKEERYAPFFADVRLYAEEQLLQRGFEGKNATFISYLLKQEKYGGCGEKENDAKGGTLRIELNDGDGELFA